MSPCADFNRGSERGGRWCAIFRMQNQLPHSLSPSFPSFTSSFLLNEHMEDRGPFPLSVFTLVFETRAFAELTAHHLSQAGWPASPQRPACHSISTQCCCYSHALLSHGKLNSRTQALYPIEPSRQLNIMLLRSRSSF